jgi:hypothetical protein
MPAGLVDEQNGVVAGRDFCCDLGKVQVHRLCIASWQNERGTLCRLRADCAKDIGRSGTLIVWRGGPATPFSPAPRDLVLLADACFVGKPDLYCGRIDALLARDFFQARGEVFLYSSMVPSACAW